MPVNFISLLSFSFPVSNPLLVPFPYAPIIGHLSWDCGPSGVDFLILLFYFIFLLTSYLHSSKYFVQYGKGALLPQAMYPQINGLGFGPGVLSPAGKLNLVVRN